MKRDILPNFFKKHKWSYFIGAIFMVLASYIQTLFPKILGETIDLLKNGNFKESQIGFNIFLIMLISFGVFVFTFTWRWFVMGNARKMECFLRAELFSHFQKLSPEFYSKKKTGDLIAYAINDILAVRMAFGPSIAMAFNGIVICFSTLFFMYTTISAKLTLLTVIPIIGVIILMIFIGNKIQEKFKIVQENFGLISDRIQENIYGIRVIKSFVQEEKEIEKFENLNKNMSSSNIKMTRISSLLTPAIDFGFALSFAVSLILGGNMVLDGTMSIGGFAAFNTYLAMILAPIVSIGRIINIFQRGVASMKRLDEIFSVEPEIKDGNRAEQERISGDIEFKNLTFAYPNSTKNALENINLKIENGKTIGIIGKSGSGKSTLVNLLFKMYNVNNNKIFLQGKDINDYSLESIRNSFGYVPQDTFLFSATIKENIVFFKEIYTDEEIEFAAQQSYIYESIRSFPDGFDSHLGERGINLSGGQRQRVAIARAIIKDPTILILDDALSAVDTVTESHILRNFKNLRKDKTTIVISHRVSAVEQSDEIIVMDGGKIVERGNQETLLKKGGVYSEIYKEQNRGNKKREQRFAI